MSLGDVIDRYQTGTYTVTRFADGEWVDGHFVESAVEITFPLDASIQPLEGATLQDLPEGLSMADVRELWTRTALKGDLRAVPTASASDAGSRPDQITIDGQQWLVWKVAHFGILDDFYKCTIHRIGAP